MPQNSKPPLCESRRVTMEANPWFASMPSTLREGLLTAAEAIHMRRGAMVYRQGDLAPVSGPAFFGLAAGTIKASTLRHDGHEAVLTVAGPGNWFGETSLIDGSARMHDTTALSALDLLVVSAEAFAQLLRQQGFALAIAALLASRVRSAYGMMEDITLRSLRARVARKLLALAHGDLLTQLPTPRVTVTLPQETLAMMLGVTRQTLSRELNALAREGAIALGYGRIELLSLDALERRI